MFFYSGLRKATIWPQNPSLWNISHWSQLKELNNREQFDIITISESWLNATITSTEIQLDGYKLICLDRLHKRGGGVCAYVRCELKSKVLKDFSSISDRNFHQLWLSVQVKKSGWYASKLLWRYIETDLHPSLVVEQANNHPWGLKLRRAWQLLSLSIVSHVKWTYSS